MNGCTLIHVSDVGRKVCSPQEPYPDHSDHFRSDPSDLDMLKIEPRPQLYDHDSRSGSSCSEEDDLEAIASYSNTSDNELNLETHETLKRNLQRKKEFAGIGLRWDVAYKTPGFQRSHAYEAPDLPITAQPVPQTSELM